MEQSLEWGLSDLTDHDNCLSSVFTWSESSKIVRVSSISIWFRKKPLSKCPLLLLKANRKLREKVSHTLRFLVSWCSQEGEQLLPRPFFLTQQNAYCAKEGKIGNCACIWHANLSSVCEGETCLNGWRVTKNAYLHTKKCPSKSTWVEKTKSWKT